MNSAGRPVTYRILVYGESWASRGRLLPELAVHAADRLNRPVRVCQIGISGANSAKLLKFNPNGLGRAALGGNPDHFILLNGVNDQAQQRGANVYAAETVLLLARASAPRAQAITAPLVRTGNPRGIANRIRIKIQSLREKEPRSLMMLYRRADYLAAIKAAVPAKQLIDFDDFAHGERALQTRYKPDGYHLTDEQFHHYGAFIGDHLAR